MKLIATLNYPVVIHYCGDDELEYVESQYQMRDLLGSLVINDGVIDSSGNYHRVISNSELLQVNSFNLEEFTLLLQKHAFALANCCITKMHFASFAEGFAFVKQSG